MKIDLITGFLGSGKTTFIKKYAEYLIGKGENIGILENDYGAVNVDMMLLGELEGDQCDLEMVPAAFDRDCHKRRFKSKLIYMGMLGYDRVIVEPSGIFDVDEFFDICREDPINRMYEIDNVIAIVDSGLDNELSKEADFYLASQIANAGCILLSRTQLTNSLQIEAVKSHIANACRQVKLERESLPAIIEKNWDDFTDEDMSKINQCSYIMSTYEKTTNPEEGSYSSVYLLEPGLKLEGLNSKIKELFDHTGKYGQIYRIKGFLYDNNQWYELNATRHETNIKPISNGQDVIIIIGENLNHETIHSSLGS